MSWRKWFNQPPPARITVTPETVPGFTVNLKPVTVRPQLPTVTSDPVDDAVLRSWQEFCQDVAEPTWDGFLALLRAKLVTANAALKEADIKADKYPADRGYRP